MNTLCTLSGRHGAADAADLESWSSVYSERVVLPGDSKTTVHVLRQALHNTVINVVNLGSARRVTEVCDELGGRVVAAMSGGFFAREARQPLGELWIAGKRQSHVPFQAPWHSVRGSLNVDADGISIGRRQMLPARPDGDLLQAGPLLVMDGRPVVDPASDAEGFRVGSQQFDSDITDGRHPRAAIGYDDMYVYSVVVDGRTDSDAGMTLTELAAYMTDDLGVTAALNLDGGGSATLVARGAAGAFHVVNDPMDGYMQPSPGGSRKLYSAIVFSRCS
jgi:uncharacterized protein YigE (DUF2233 family)